MAPAITDLALQAASVAMSGKGGGSGNSPNKHWTNKHWTYKRPPPFLNARRQNFSVLFSWARVTRDSLPYAMLVVFIGSVFCTILMHILSELERTTLSRRYTHTITPSERLIAGLAYMCRMGIMYLFIVILMTQNLYMLCAILIGHLFGWVIFSAMGSSSSSNATEQNRLQQEERMQQDEQMKRKKEKQLDNDADITEFEDDDDDDDDDDDSQCDKRV